MAVQKELAENRKEINLMAREALLSVGATINPAKLYWLQLVRWGVSSGKLRGFNSHLLLFLELLEGSEPEAVMRFLEGTGKEKNPPLKSHGKWDSLDMARFLLIYLDHRMTEKVEGYSQIHPHEVPQPDSADSKIA